MVKKVIFILILILALTGLLLCIPTEEKNSWDFNLSVWGPASLLVKGQAPYQIYPPYGPYAATWWPQIIGINFWMGWLSLKLASKIWLAIELVCFSYAIWLLKDRKKLTPLELGLTVLVILLYPPIYTHLHLGQFSLLFTSIMLMISFSEKGLFYAEKPAGWALLFLVLGAAKPQLIILVYPGILAALIQKRSWHNLALLCGKTLCFLAVCLLPLFILHLRWFSGFVEATLYNLDAGWAQPTLFYQFKQNLGSIGLPLWIVLYAALLALCLYIWLKKGPRKGMLWSLALTPLATAYCFSWDFTLLLPLFFWLFFHFEDLWSRVNLLTGIFMVDIWQIIPRFGKTNVPEHKQWWVPIVLLAVFILSMQIEQWKAPFSLAAMPAHKKNRGKEAVQKSDLKLNNLL